MEMYGCQQCSLLRLLLPLTLVSAASASPCCPDNMLMTRGREKAIECLDTSPSLVYTWCEDIYAEFNYTEDENRTRLVFGDMEEHRYCTGIFAKNAFPKDHHLAKNPGKEVALVCFDVEEPLSGHYTVYALCLLASSVFLLATVLVYLALPELRDLQGRCVLCFVTSLMCGYLCLAYLQHPATSPYTADTACVILAFVTYFWMVSAFFWLNISSFNMWRSAVLSHVSMSEKRLMWGYHLAGWGVPLLFLLFALVTHNIPGDHLQPNFGKQSCWFQGRLELWTFFYGPVLVLLILNIIYFISTARYLWADYRSPNPMPRVKTLRNKFCLYLKLFLVMGIPWIFEIFSFIASEPWYVTDILNCLQGLIIFMMMIALRKRVWRALAAKKLFGVQATSCWRKLDDEDTATENEDNFNTNVPDKPYELVAGHKLQAPSQNPTNINA